LWSVFEVDEEGVVVAVEFLGDGDECGPGFAGSGFSADGVDGVGVEEGFAVAAGQGGCCGALGGAGEDVGEVDGCPGVGGAWVVDAGDAEGDVCELCCGGLDEVGDVAVGGVSECGDAGAGFDEAAEGGLFGDDLGVVPGAFRYGGGVDELVEVCLSADAGEVF